MDKKYNLHDDEEYQLQEPESSANFATASASPETSGAIFERIKRQHIVLGFIFIFLVFGVYKLINGFFHVIAKQQAVAKVQKQAPISKINASNVYPEVKTDVATSRLDHLAQGQLDVQSAIQSLDLQLSGIQTTLANLSNQLTQVNDEVQSLHTGQETLIQNQTKPIKKITTQKKVSPKPIYYLRAVIPGRAWLITPEGSTLTLGVGDKLEGYGVVDAINPDQGTVTLNSGAVIGYSPDDR